MDDYTKSLAVMTWMTLIAAIWMFFTVEAWSIQLPVSKNSTADAVLICSRDAFTDSE